MKKTTYTLEDWQADLAEISFTDKVEAGFYQPEELAKQFGIRIETLRKRLNKMVNDGRAECKKFRVKVVDGRMMPHSFYKLLNKK